MVSAIKFGAIQKLVIPGSRTSMIELSDTEPTFIQQRFELYKSIREKNHQTPVALFKLNGYERLLADGDDVAKIQSELARYPELPKEKPRKYPETLVGLFALRMWEFAREKFNKYLDPRNRVIRDHLKQAEKQGQVINLKLAEPGMFQRKPVAEVVQSLYQPIEATNLKSGEDFLIRSGHDGIKLESYGSEQIFIKFFHKNHANKQERYHALVDAIKQMDGAYGFEFSEQSREYSDAKLESLDWKKKGALERALDVKGFLQGYPVNIQFRFSDPY